MSRAARLALRGHGGAEPNPMVGCIIVSPAGDVVGRGYHRRCGDAHAEINALRDAGERARGATVYVTLEPCTHTGRTGPCTEALIDAGVARVVIGRIDPNTQASGGIARLRDADIRIDVMPDHAAARAVTAPFEHRVRTGRPWVIAKWAQTIDGRLATRSGESQWISSEQSRRMVHRERGRVDAILTGIGTVLADDPMLTARHGRPRRIARRVIIDPKLRTPVGANLVTSAHSIPTIIACRPSLLQTPSVEVDRLRDAGVELIPLPLDDSAAPLHPVLTHLCDAHDCTNVLVEAGAGLLGQLLDQHLVDEAWVFMAPLIIGDEDALPVAKGVATTHLRDARRFRLVDLRQRGGDVMARYRRIDVATP